MSMLVTGRLEPSRFCRLRATVVASRCTRSWAYATWSCFRTKASGSPNSTTAVTATASVENSSRRRMSVCPAHALVAPFEAEPHPAHRGDVARVLGVVAQLAAEPGDVHVEGLGGSPPLAVPHLAHDLLPGHHLSCLVHQHGEQVELLGGEVELGVAEPGPAGFGVHPYPLGHAGLRAATAEQGADAGQELGQPERLGH